MNKKNEAIRHQANGLAKNTRKGMDDVHHRFKVVDQLAISLSIVFEFVHLFFEQLKNVIGRMAGLKSVSKRVLGRVYPGLLGIVGEGYIEDGLQFVEDIYCLFGSGGTGWVRETPTAVLAQSSPEQGGPP